MPKISSHDRVGSRSQGKLHRSLSMFDPKHATILIYKYQEDQGVGRPCHIEYCDEYFVSLIGAIEIQPLTKAMIFCVSIKN